MPDFFAALEFETQTQSRTKPRPEMRCDVLVIGAGPTGLACAIEAQKVGLKVVVLDKGCLVNSLYHYPKGMLFFTTPDHVWAIDARTGLIPTGGQSIKRALGYIFSLALFGLGLALAFIDRDHRTLHDRFSQTIVIRN